MRQFTYSFRRQKVRFFSGYLLGLGIAATDLLLVIKGENDEGILEELSGQYRVNIVNLPEILLTTKGVNYLLLKFQEKEPELIEHLREWLEIKKVRIIETLNREIYQLQQEKLKEKELRDEQLAWFQEQAIWYLNRIKSVSNNQDSCYHLERAYKQAIQDKIWLQTYLGLCLKNLI